MARREALIWAIDDYPGTSNDLPSCIADSLAFRDMLENVYGFDRSSIRMLHNQDATYAKVTAGLDSLFADAKADDQLVVYVSSHGWQFEEGQEMIQVLCLYDDFLRDTDLVQRTAGLPPGVVTITCDACNTGGLEKLFFPGGPNVEVARTKVWTPPPELAERKRQLLRQVTNVRLFGRSSTGEAATLAKNFHNVPELGVLPSTKDLAAGAPTINAVLFTACRADQTAAAGTARTNHLSAFTYAILEEVHGSVSVSDLRERVARRLKGLNMSQDPQLFAPPTRPQRLAEKYLSVAGSSTTSPSGNFGPTFDELFNSLTQKTKEFSMTTTTTTDPFDQVSAEISKAFTGGGTTPSGGGVTSDQAKIVAAFAGAYQSMVAQDPTKAFAATKSGGDDEPQNPEQLADPKFWGIAIPAITSLAGELIRAVSKDFQSSSNFQDAVSDVPQQYVQDKAWQDFATRTLMYGCYQTLRGLGGKLTASVPQLQQPPTPPAGVDKGWLSSAFNFVQRGARVAMPIVRQLLD